MKTGIYTFAKLSVISVLLCTPALSAASSEYPLTINIRQLSFDTALRIGKAAIDKCRKEGVQISVTVVDRGGNEQIMLRDTLAMDVSTPISKKKAYTALVFNLPTSAMENRFPGAYSVPKMDSLMVSAGGIPINIGGTILGGIGVSGAPSGLTDESCAQAGLDAVREDLEMQN
jgi:uncharacterized protein GlcG (DUF336 family)